MKVLLFAVLAGLLLVACHRNKCNIATVTQSGTPCSSWGIKLGSQTYPADSIPDNFKHEGVLVCVNYELYADVRMCPCCGGTRAKIKSIRYPNE